MFHYVFLNINFAFCFKINFSMNVDSESSSSKKTGGENSKRTNYFRGSQKRGGAFNRYKYPNHQRANNSPSHYSEELETNNNTNSASDNVTDQFSTLHVYPSNNFRGPNKQIFNRTQYNFPRQTDHRNPSKDHNRSFNHTPCTAEQDSAESSSTSNVPKPSQRGQIVGGRYIRKQPLYSNSSKAYRDFQPENSYEYERNYNMRYQPNSSYKYKNSNSYHNETQEHPRKDETYNRHVNDSSSESGSQHNASYQPREFKKKYTDSHNSSYKYNNYSSSSEEATNYKSNKFFKQRTSQQKPKRTISEDDKATQRGEFYLFFIFLITF